MTNAKELEQELERLRQENEQLKARQTPALRFKVSEKGAVSIYGLGRFPVTLYAEHWDRLLAEAAELRAFLEENRARLKLKTD